MADDNSLLDASFLRPQVRLLADETIRDVIAEAKQILNDVGVFVEWRPGIEHLVRVGGREVGDARVTIPATVVEECLEAAPSQVVLYDRSGENSVELARDDVCFVPGSSAINVLDHELGEMRPATTSDCIAFARLTDQMPGFALQSTCVVPSDVPDVASDRYRLRWALEHCSKPIVTGVFQSESFERMASMLTAVRGGDAELRRRPLAVFDSCPTAPLRWSELAIRSLMDCARAGIPAQAISVPMTGATAPVTLLGALTQHTAENLSALVIHQTTEPGAPFVYGGCASAVDMRLGTMPFGAIESAMLNLSAATIGKALGLATHAYMALSDAKIVDYQAGLETGYGAVLAALGGINVVAGPGMLAFVGCQSLEKLLLDHETCLLALRATKGLVRRDDEMALPVLQEAGASEQFLNLDHTRRWFRKELHLPGPTIDRQGPDGWTAAGSKSAALRAHEEVTRLLSEEPTGRTLDANLVNRLEELAAP